ncbi:MAG: hypothetical protein HOW73_22890 [Polyangiaceae bacterium]|nr:hypothetical protein [Polyangiaceae bacterium]
MLVLVSLTGTVTANASERPRIVVLTDAKGAALAERMRAELGTMGFDADVITDPADDDIAAELRDVALREDAIAAVRAVAKGETLRLWLLDRSTGKTLSRELEQASSGGHDRTLAIRAVELLRASLLELQLPDAPRGDVEPTPKLLDAAQVPAIAPEKPPSEPAPAPTSPKPVMPDSAPLPEATQVFRNPPLVAAEIGAGVVGSPGGLPPFAALVASLGGYVAPRIRIGAFGIAPLQSMHHEGTLNGETNSNAPKGESETKVGVVGADVRVELLDGMWRPSVGGGVAIVILATEGVEAAPGYLSESGTIASMGAYVRPGFAFEPVPQLRLRADGVVGAQLRPLLVEYAGTEAARWGAPWFAGSLSLEARLP